MLRSWFQCSLSMFAAMSMTSNPAAADEFSEKFEFFGETRLRLEVADEDAFSEDAVALTQLIRPALEFRATPRLTALIEGEALFSIVDEFNDGTGNNPGLSLIPDPNGLELNRLQLQYEVTDQTFLTVGRQKISIDDQRFIGPAAFRQNDQTFDAVGLSTRSFGSTTIQAGYFNRVNRVFGADNPFGRFRGDSFYVNVNTPTPIGRVGAFHYAFDLGTSSPTPMSDIFSSQTSGVRLDGRFHRDEFGLDWEASFARQTEFADNPNDYSANYWLLGLRGFAGPARLGVRFETFGSNGEQAFQTPLGTLHRFQGAADVFVITPDQGLEDLEISASYSLGRTGPFRNVTVGAQYHNFNAENGGLRFGDEVDFDIIVAYKQFQVGFTAAYYEADTFATDTRRFFLSLTYRY